MGLDESTDAFVGPLLDVRPFYGWGWDGNVEAPAAPESFRVRLHRIWRERGDRRGGVGLVQEPGHRYHGYWVLFSTRHEGTFNFTSAPGHYNVSLSETEPVDNSSGWPVAAAGGDHAAGYAEIVGCGS